MITEIENRRGTQSHSATATVGGLICITSSYAADDDDHGLGTGIQLGAGHAPVIEHSLIVGTSTGDADPRVNYCLHIDNRATHGTWKAEPLAFNASTLHDSVFAREDKTDGGTVEAWAASGNNQFVDVGAPIDPTSATDTELQSLSGTLPIYFLNYDELRITGASTTITSLDGAEFPSATLKSSTPDWLLPRSIDWTCGIFEGSCAKPLWFRPFKQPSIPRQQGTKLNPA